MGTATRGDSGGEQRFADVESSVKVLHPDITLEVRQAQLAGADDPIQLRDDLFAAGFANSVSGNDSGLQLNIFRPLPDPRSGGLDLLGRSRYEQILSIDKNGVATVDAYRRSPEPGEKEEENFSDQRYFDSLRAGQRRRNPHAEFNSIGQDALYYMENKRHKPRAPFGDFEA